MKIIKKENLNINELIKTLKSGGLVIYPTETMYGIGADATNAKAIKKLTRYKKRPFGKPYSIAVSNQRMAQKYIYLNETGKNLYRTFLPGPMTVISWGKHKVAPGVESENGTLGIRIPNYQMVLEIVKKFGKPITATSANQSYQKRPYKISDILENISGRQKKLIDLIIDAGELPRNEPSTVVDTTLDDLTILRQGEIKLKDKNEVLSRSEENTQNLAKELWQKYEKHKGQRAIIFALEGPMGAGKTQFTKGLARAMGIIEEITSPTYNLVNSYKPKTKSIKLTHMDAWRLENSKELEGLGLKDEISDKSVIAIEWADKVSDVIRSYSEEAIIVWLKINYLPAQAGGKAENERLISWGVL